MSEFAPPWSGAKMTSAQVKKYIKDLEEKRRLAQAKLDEARASWEFNRDEEELKRLEKALDDII